MKILNIALASALLGLTACGQGTAAQYGDEARIEWFLGYPSAEPHSIVWQIDGGQVERTETEEGETTVWSYPLADKEAYEAALTKFLDTKVGDLCMDANRVTVNVTVDGGEREEWLQQCGDEGEVADALLATIEGGPA